MLRTQDDDVGLDSLLLQVFHRVLRRLGFQFLSRSQVGHVGQVDTTAVSAQLPFELAHRLYIRQALDVAHRAANLRDDEVIVIGLPEQLNLMFYLVGDMGHHLHGLTKVVASALFLDDILVDTPRSDIVRAMGAHIQEALVVPQVQICFVPVFGNIAFPVLVGVERPRVYVDVRV